MDEASPSTEVTALLPLANKMAFRVWSEGGRTLELEDLQSQANLILLQIIDGYDASRGDLQRYVRSVIRYRLIDYIRSTNPNKRHIEKHKHVGLDNVVVSDERSNFEHDVLLRRDIDKLIRHPVLTPKEYRLMKIVSRSDTPLKVLAQRRRTSIGMIRQILFSAKNKLKLHGGSELYALYVEQQLSTCKIAKLFHTTEKRVRMVLIALGIPRRHPKKIANTVCRYCSKYAYKWGRCRTHYNVYQAERSKRYRGEAKPRTFESRSIASKLCWQKRYERYGKQGSSVSQSAVKLSKFTAEQRSDIVRRAWLKRKSNNDK